MQFEYTDKVKALIARLQAFFDEHVYPNEAGNELVAGAKARRAGNRFRSSKS